MIATRFWSAAILSSALAIAGCDSKDHGQPPQVASSSHESGYAEAYPDELDGSAQRIASHHEALTTQTSQFESYPDAIKEPTDYALVVDIVKTADDAGRSQRYADTARENATVEKVMKEKNGAVLKKVAGAVGFVAKQQGCDSGDVSGAAAGALKRAMEKRLEERQREANEAHGLIDRNRDDLGKKNVATLQKQSDEISQASYLAFVALPTERARYLKLLEENDKVADTLDRSIEDEQRREQDGNASPAQQKARAKRIEALQQSKSKLVDARQQHEENVKHLDEQIKAAQKEYGEAFNALLDELEKRAKDSPEQPAA